jgi:hypothetical protein
MVAVPAAMPVTTPDELTFAMDIAELLHVPPEGELVSVTVAPAVTVDGPEIVPAEGMVYTETTNVEVAVPTV